MISDHSTISSAELLADLKNNYVNGSTYVQVDEDDIYSMNSEVDVRKVGAIKG